MKQRGGSRVVVVLMAMGLILATAPPVAGRGKPRAETVSVEMSLETAGIATTCGESVLTMQPSGDGLMRADWEGTDTQVEMVFPISWIRNHPVTQSAAEFGGCHGGLVEGSHDGFGGYFIIDSGGSGSVHLASRFDYYWEFSRVFKGKKVRSQQEVLEFFEVTADLARTDGRDFDSTPTGQPQELTGVLELRWFEKIGDELVWTTLGAAEITVTITIRQP